MAFEPLAELAAEGIPVFVVPGNHERSRIPYRLLAARPGIHIFDRPRTFVLQKGDFTLALAGFPYQRDNVRAHFPALLQQTGYERQSAHARLLCMHHCVEGSAVKSGNREHVFTTADDVVRIHDIPTGFIAALSGHIHRHQVLTRDLSNRPAHTPVLYPGSIERTSFAEKEETKGYLMLELSTDGDRHGVLKWRFCPLPTRPMKEIDIDGLGVSAEKLKAYLLYVFKTLPADAVVKIRVKGGLSDDARSVLRVASLRSLAPATMNVEVRDLSEASFFLKQSTEISYT